VTTDILPVPPGKFNISGRWTTHMLVELQKERMEAPIRVAALDDQL
jgi:hypothetical protein